MAYYNTYQYFNFGCDQIVPQNSFENFKSFQNHNYYTNNTNYYQPPTPPHYANENYFYFPQNSAENSLIKSVHNNYYGKIINNLEYSCCKRENFEVI